MSEERPADGGRETADVRRRYDRASWYYNLQIWPMDLLGRSGALFDRLDPLISRAGPHINRRTVDNVRAAGLTIETEQNRFSDVLKLIVARA